MIVQLNKLGEIVSQCHCKSDDTVSQCHGKSDEAISNADFLVWTHIYLLFLYGTESPFYYSVGKELTKRGSADLSRTSKKDKRTDDLTRSKTNITDLARSSNNARSSNKKRRTDDLTSRKKEKKTCTGGGKKKSLISGLLITSFI